MTLDYTWKVEDAEAYPTLTVDGVEYQNVVHTVHWRLNVRDLDANGDVLLAPDGTTPLVATAYGTITMDTSDVTAETFIDQTDLDAQTLAHWAAVAIETEGAGDVQRIRDGLAARIEATRNPPSVSLGLSGEVSDSALPA